MYMLCSHYKAHRQDNALTANRKLSGEDSPDTHESVVVRLQTFADESDATSNITDDMLHGAEVYFAEETDDSGRTTAVEKPFVQTLPQDHQLRKTEFDFLQ